MEPYEEQYELEDAVYTSFLYRLSALAVENLQDDRASLEEGLVYPESTDETTSRITLLPQARDKFEAITIFDALMNAYIENGVPSPSFENWIKGSDVSTCLEAVIYLQLAIFVYLSEYANLEDRSFLGLYRLLNTESERDSSWRITALDVIFKELATGKRKIRTSKVKVKSVDDAEHLHYDPNGVQGFKIIGSPLVRRSDGANVKDPQAFDPNKDVSLQLYKCYRDRIERLDDSLAMEKLVDICIFPLERMKVYNHALNFKQEGLKRIILTAKDDELRGDFEKSDTPVGEPKEPKIEKLNSLKEVSGSKSCEIDCWEDDIYGTLLRMSHNL